MNKRTSIAVDILFVFACIDAVCMVVFACIGHETAQLSSGIAACFCLLMAVLLCVYPRGRA